MSCLVQSVSVSADRLVGMIIAHDVDNIGSLLFFPRFWQDPNRALELTPNKVVAVIKWVFIWLNYISCLEYFFSE